MAFAKILALGALSFVAATPLVERQTESIAGLCLTSSQAQQVATNYGTLISTFSATLANNTLAVDYTDYSESVNSLIDSCPTGTDGAQLPLLGPTVTNRAEFEAAQAGQPNNNYQQLDLWYTCNTVIWRWETTNGGGGPRPVVGLIVAEVTRNSQLVSEYPWLISTLYSEFDAAAWLQNLIESGDCPATACDSSSGLGASTTAAAAGSTSTSSGIDFGKITINLPF